MKPYRTGERELAAGHSLSLEPDDLALYDRGFPAFWLFAFHPIEQRHFCARVKYDFHPQVTAFLADGVKQRTVSLSPNRAGVRQCREYHLPPDPLP